MINWEGCPIGLFDLYMEVGEVKTVEAGDKRVWIEVWIGSSFAKECSRSECKNIRRRPIFSVMKQILKLSGNGKAGLIFQCDDPDSWGNDTENQSGAIFLLLRELKLLGKLGPVLMFTRKSREQIRQRSSGFQSQRDKAEYDGLYEMLDVLVTRQANRYSGSGIVIAKDKGLLSGLSWLLPRGRQD